VYCRGRRVDGSHSGCTNGRRLHRRITVHDNVGVGHCNALTTQWLWSNSRALKSAVTKELHRNVTDDMTARARRKARTRLLALALHDGGGENSGDCDGQR
jgi:hypothetical protein